MKNYLLVDALSLSETTLHSNLAEQRFLLSGCEKEPIQKSLSLAWKKMVGQAPSQQHAVSPANTIDSCDKRTNQKNPQQTMNGTVHNTKIESPQEQLIAMKLTQEEAQFLLMMCVITSVEGSEQLEHSVLEKIHEVVRRFEK